MSLRECLIRILDEYQLARHQEFGNHPMANFIREDFARAIADVVRDEERYLIEGSPGIGRWAGIPWGAVFDRLITDSAQEGYYLVYLFRRDASGVYLSLNQGVTTVKRQYGRKRKTALLIRAADYLARLTSSENVGPGVITGPIDLRINTAGDLGADYEKGSICALLYESNNIPSDEVLYSELRLFLEYYASLVSRPSELFNQIELEEDESGLAFEDLRNLRYHKRVERNRKLAANAKKKLGFTCQACGLRFESVYGDIGRDYIEAHHLTPVAELKGKRVALDPSKDFAVLCSNCHRMIHRSAYISDVEAFRLHVLNQS